MATGKRRRRATKPRPEDRLDDLSFKIESVKRRWSRGPRWDINTRRPAGIESGDYFEISGVIGQKNELEIESVYLTISSQSREESEDQGFLGLCNRKRGDRNLLNGFLWLPLEEMMSLAPSLMGRQFVELELRVRGFFRGKGRIESIGFRSELAAYEDWVIEVQEQGSLTS